MQITFFSFFLLTAYSLTAQQLVNSDYAAYIKKYKSIAIREMELYKIPASITLAQGMIESGCGKSKLALDTRNHFGIKCQQDWPGDTYLHDDDREKECFRKYKSVDESFRDHSIFLTTRKRYSALFTLSINDYKGWARGLKQAGYATNPDYPNILIRLIEANKLYLLDGPAGNSEEIAINGPETEIDQDAPKPDKKSQDKKSQDKKGLDKKKPTKTDDRLVIKEDRVFFRKNYDMPAPSGFKTLYASNSGRKVYTNCNVPFIFAKKDDSWYSIAKEFHMFIFHVYRQNDLRESDQITPGQMLYLKSKKKANPDKTYKVKKGDSMYSISQEKCIKLKLLLKYNNLEQFDEPRPGVELKLEE
ncbi:MAG: glucosaminidase domain-containing protein [Bacteroidales bacterium]|nr:glucosaminidase domain-containing protein [Bacteroidales bacterium]